MLLTDKPANNNDPRKLPTYDNILEAMRWLVRGAKPNDSLFLHCMFFFLVSSCFSSFFFEEIYWWWWWLFRFWTWWTNSRFGWRWGGWLGWRQVLLFTCNSRFRPIVICFSHLPFGLQEERTHRWRCKFFWYIWYIYVSYSWFFFPLAFIQLMHDILVNFVHYLCMTTSNSKVWKKICFQVKPLPRGCRLTVRCLFPSEICLLHILVLITDG